MSKKCCLCLWRNSKPKKIVPAQDKSKQVNSTPIKKESKDKIKKSDFETVDLKNSESKKKSNSLFNWFFLSNLLQSEISSSDKCHDRHHHPSSHDNSSRWHSGGDHSSSGHSSGGYSSGFDGGHFGGHSGGHH